MGGGVRFRVWALACLLKNRAYIGDVASRVPAREIRGGRSHELRACGAHELRGEQNHARFFSRISSTNRVNR
jgi:hypothetical protein